MYFDLDEPERSTDNVQDGFDQPFPAPCPEACPIYTFPPTQSLKSSNYRVVSAPANNYQHHQVSSAPNGSYLPPTQASLPIPSSSRADFTTASVKPEKSRPQPSNRKGQPSKKPPKQRKRPVVQHPSPARFDMPCTDVCVFSPQCRPCRIKHTRCDLGTPCYQCAGTEQAQDCVYSPVSPSSDPCP